MVIARVYLPVAGMLLSVLALSSRFDGPLVPFVVLVSAPLSVLALSSRFDGLCCWTSPARL